MRISDWSSDVCSSDLAECAAGWLNRRENGSRSCHGFTRMTRMTRMTRIKKKKEKKHAMDGRTVQLPGSVLIRVIRVNPDRKSVGEGKSVSVRVDLGGRRIIKKKNNRKKKMKQQ